MTLEVAVRARLAAELRRLATTLSRWASTLERPRSRGHESGDSRAEGPPEHWLAMVSERAPGLLHGDAIGLPPPRPEEPAWGARRPPPPRWQHSSSHGTTRRADPRHEHRFPETGRRARAEPRWPSPGDEDQLRAAPRWWSWPRSIVRALLRWPPPTATRATALASWPPRRSPVADRSGDGQRWSPVAPRSARPPANPPGSDEQAHWAGSEHPEQRSGVEPPLRPEPPRRPDRPRRRGPTTGPEPQHGSFDHGAVADPWPVLPDDAELREPARALAATEPSPVAHLIAEQRGR